LSTTLLAIKATVPALSVSVKFNDCASVIAPVLIVLVTAPLPAVSILLVPVYEKFVGVAVFQYVTAVFAVNLIFPLEPNAIVLLLAFVDANKPVVNVRSFRFNVPLVNVVVLALDNAKLLCNVQEPLTPLKVHGKSYVTVPAVISLVDTLVLPNVHAFAPAVNVVVPFVLL